MEVGFGFVVVSPDRHGVDEVGVDMGEVELFHSIDRKELGGVAESVDGWVEFFYDVVNGLMMFEVVLDDVSK